LLSAWGKGSPRAAKVLHKVSGRAGLRTWALIHETLNVESGAVRRLGNLQRRPGYHKESPASPARKQTASQRTISAVPSLPCSPPRPTSAPL
jgi:hypothetical protein